MLKSVPILKLFHSFNFLREDNSDGKVVDLSGEDIIRLRPIPSVENQIREIRGNILLNEYGTQVHVPMDFSSAPPTSSINLLSGDLVFEIQVTNMNTFSLTGLNFAKGRLMLASGNPSKDYTINKRKVSCIPYGKSAIVTENDLFEFIPTNISLDQIQRLIKKPLGTADQPLDLKAKIDSEEIPITNDEGLRKLHLALKAKLFKTVPVTFSRNSNNSLLRGIPAALISEPLSVHAIGYVIIPVASLILNQNNPDAYKDINNFIIHFPVVRSNIDFTYNTKEFPNNTFLYFNDDLLNTSVSNHPQMPDYKQVKASVLNYPCFYTRKNVSLSRMEISPNLLP